VELSGVLATSSRHGSITPCGINALVCIFHDTIVVRP
jgi:hypothetical protein